MITTGKVKDTVWLMSGNKPVQHYIAEVRTVTTATGTTISYGLHDKLVEVGKTAPSKFYSPEVLFSSKDELKTAVFGLSSL